MRTRTWLILFGALAVAGLVDTWTLMLTPLTIRAYDISFVVRTWPDIPLALVAFKLGIVGGGIVVIPLARYIGPRTERFVGGVIIACAALWVGGAWSNVAFGWR